MEEYDEINGTVTINRSIISSCSYNSGSVTIKDDAHIINCKLNIGTINIGKRVSIVTLSCNGGRITIGDNCLITEIKFNVGVIILGRNCLVCDISDNSGRIIVGPGTEVRRTKYNFGKIIRTNETTTSMIPGSVLARAALNRIDDFIQVLSPATDSTSPDQSIEDTSQLPTDDASQVIVSSNTESGSGISYETTLEPNTADPESLPSPTDSDIEIDKTICSICLMNMKNVAFSCGHVCCSICYEKLAKCHMCRLRIKRSKTLKIFL